MGVSEEIEALPHIDEHAVEVEAGAEATWEALQVVFDRSFGGGASPRIARLLGCEDPSGFHVADSEPPAASGAADAPALLAYAGSHRFSRYALVFRLDPLDPGRTRLRAETRAVFPSLKGAIYRTAVIGTRGHVLVTRRLLGAVRSRAERSSPERAAAA